jgi:hypothetical protein
MKLKNILMILLASSFSQLAFACDDKDVVGKWIGTSSQDQDSGYLFNKNYQFIILHKGKPLGSGENGYKANWVVDCTHTPAHLTMTMTDKHGGSTALKAIFMKLTDDHLVIRHGYEGVRPSSFNNQAKDQTEFTRVKQTR